MNSAIKESLKAERFDCKKSSGSVNHEECKSLCTVDSLTCKKCNRSFRPKEHNALPEVG